MGWGGRVRSILFRGPTWESSLGREEEEKKKKEKKKEKKKKDKKTTTGNWTKRVEIRNRKTFLPVGGERVAIF